MGVGVGFGFGFGVGVGVGVGLGLGLPVHVRQAQRKATARADGRLLPRGSPPQDDGGDPLVVVRRLSEARSVRTRARFGSEPAVRGSSPVCDLTGLLAMGRAPVCVAVVPRALTLTLTLALALALTLALTLTLTLAVAVTVRVWPYLELV